MHIQYPSDSTFWDQIQKLILEGHTKAALKLLLDKDYPIAKVLDNQLDKIQEQYELELIWFDEWDKKRRRKLCCCLCKLDTKT